MKQGEIYLVSFDPSFGNEMQKMRPALVIQSEVITSNLVTIIPFSSKTEKQFLEEILVLKSDHNRLFSDSILRIRQISSFDKKRCVHFIGNLEENYLKMCKEYLKKHFSIN